MEIKNRRSADVQRETAYLAHYFACASRVPIILGAPRNELGDDVSVQFIGHVPQKITRGNGGLTGTPSINHAVRIVVKDLLLKDVQRLVELEPSMARSESRHKDIGLGAFDGIVLDTGVDSLQDVVGTETESTEIESRIGDEIEQMGGVLDSDGGGFVHPLAKLAPETVQHQFGGSLATGIFGNAGDVQSDTLPFLVAENVLSFLLEGLTPTGPPRGLLFQLEPGVDVCGEKTRPALLGGKMPDFVDLDQRVPLFDGFDEFGRTPGSA